MVEYQLGNVDYIEYPRTSSPFGLSAIDNVVFGRSGASVRKSIDEGRSFQDWFTPEDSELIYLETLIAVNKNKVIGGYASDNPNKKGYYLIEVKGETSTIEMLGVFDTDWASIGFSQDRYPRHGDENKIILIGEYGKRDIGNYARHLYVYVEETNVFKEIFELPELDPGKTHLHGSHYDWRTDTVWACGGDSRAVSLWYSNNWRNENPDWNQVWATGTDPVQFTSIWSTETQILLGSDGVGDDGLYALNKNSENVYNNPTLIKLFHLRDYQDAQGVPLVARTFLETTTGEIYVLFSSKTSFPSVLLGTKDRVNWYKVVETTESDLSVVDLVNDKMLAMYSVNNLNNYRLFNVEWIKLGSEPVIIKDSKRVLEGYFVVNQNGVITGVPMTNLSGLTQGTLVWGSPE